MFKRVLLLLTAVFFIGCVNTTYVSVDKFRASVFPLIAENRIGDRIVSVSVIGTSFALTKKHLFSAGHVCKALVFRQRKWERRTRKDNIARKPKRTLAFVVEIQKKNSEVTIIAWEFNPFTGDPDYCLLELVEVNHSIVPLELQVVLWPYYNTNPSVVIVGSPYGHYLAAETGPLITTYKTGMPNSYIYGKILVAITAAPGYSGSPIIAGDGKVIGMVTFGYITAVVGGLNSHLIVQFIAKYL